MEIVDYSSSSLHAHFSDILLLLLLWVTHYAYISTVNVMFCGCVIYCSARKTLRTWCNDRCPWCNKQADESNLTKANPSSELYVRSNGAIPITQNSLQINPLPLGCGYLICILCKYNWKYATVIACNITQAMCSFTLAVRRTARCNARSDPTIVCACYTLNAQFYTTACGSTYLGM